MTGESGKVYESVGTSIPPRQKRLHPPVENYERPPLTRVIGTYFCYALCILWGHLSDVLRRLGLKRDGGCDLGEDVRSVVQYASLSFVTGATRKLYHM